MHEFVTAPQRQCYKKVARLMVQGFGDQVEASLQLPEFTIAAGSARIDVKVTPWRNDVIVNVQAKVISGVEVNETLLLFLLNENVQFDIGGFGLDPDGNVVFGQSIIGDSLTENVLTKTVKTVMLIADQYDDRIQARWGGKRATDDPTMRGGIEPEQVQVYAPGSEDDGSETIQMSAEDIIGQS